MLFVSASFVVFAQDGQNATAVGEKTVEKPVGKTVLAENTVTQITQEGKATQTSESEQIDSTSNDQWKSVKKFINEIVFKIFILGIIVSVIGGVILLVIKDIGIYLRGVFYFRTKWRNGFFCKDGFAKQIQTIKKLPQNAPLKEILKNTYISMSEGGYQTARSKLFGPDTINSGIFVVVGKLFTGRQFFLERELTGHNTDIFEIEEDKWLVKNHEQNTIILNEIFAKRLWVLGKKWKLSIGKYSHKAIILLAESLSEKELNDVINLLTEMLEKMKGLWSHINYQKLTLILKTNVYYYERNKDDDFIHVETLEFDHQSKAEALYTVFLNKEWDENLQNKIKDDLEKSPYYQEVTISDEVSTPLETALWLNTFGQPKAIKSLYQMEAAKGVEHWQNIFMNWERVCKKYNVPLDKFLAFLWMRALLHIDGSTLKASNVFKDISHGNVKDERWIKWEDGLSPLLQEIFGEDADDTYDFVGDNDKQLDEFEWAAFLMKMMEKDDAFAYPIKFTNIQKQIKNNLPYFTWVLGGTNDKTWNEYKELIAGNLIEACIKINRFDVRDIVLNRIIRTLKNRELYNHEDCTRLEEIAETLIQIRNNRKKEFDLLSFLEEHWIEWSALERNHWLNIYLNRQSDSDYLNALIAILPLLISFSGIYGKIFNLSDIDSDYLISEKYFLKIKTYLTDIIFDFSSNGLLSRVFIMPIVHLSEDDKTKKIIAMKLLEIIFNDGKELRNLDSYMGLSWKDKPYISASSAQIDNTWTIFLKEINALHGYIKLCLTDEEEKVFISERCKNLLQLLNINEKKINPFLYIYKKQLIISCLISIISYDNLKIVLDCLVDSKLLMSEDFYSDYFYNIFDMYEQLNDLLKNKELEKAPRIDSNTFNVNNCFIFVMLVAYFQKNNMIIVNDWNQSRICEIYKECFNCLCRVDNLNNSIWTIVLTKCNYILCNMDYDMIQHGNYSSDSIKNIFIKDINYIYNRLFIEINGFASIGGLLDAIVSSNKLNSLLDIPDNIFENLSNKVYLCLSRVMIIDSHIFQVINDSNKECLQNAQDNNWSKKLAINLGELVYQEIAWIFNNHSSINNEKISKLRGNMSDLEFFQQSLIEFSRYVLPKDIQLLETIVFLLCVISSIICDLFIYHNKDFDNYKQLFKDFVNNQNNPQKCSLYESLDKALKNQKCMQFLEYSLFIVGVFDYSDINSKIIAMQE